MAGGSEAVPPARCRSPRSAIPWSYANTSPGVYPSATSVALSSSNGAIGYSAIASSANGWLLINNGYNISGFVGSTPLTLSPFTANIAALWPGTYFGTVNITGSDDSTGTITVTLTVTGNTTGTTGLNPSLSAINLVGATPGSETITTSSSASITFAPTSPTITGTRSGFASTAHSRCCLLTYPPLPYTVTVGNCPGQNLINFTGTHTATLTLVPTNSSGVANVIIPISYTVGSGGGVAYGCGYPSSLNATVAYGNQTTVSFTLTTSSTRQWLSPSRVRRSVGRVGFRYPEIRASVVGAAGRHRCHFERRGTAGDSPRGYADGEQSTGTLDIPVTLNNGVTRNGNRYRNGGATGSLSVSPTTVAWSYSTSNPGAYPNPSSISLTSTNGAIGYTAQASSSNNWLLVNSGLTAAGTVGQTALTLSPSTNLAALTPGLYPGTVSITGSDGSTATIAVTASVLGAGSVNIGIFRSANGLFIEDANGNGIQDPNVAGGDNIFSLTGFTLLSTEAAADRSTGRRVRRRATASTCARCAWTVTATRSWCWWTSTARGPATPGSGPASTAPSAAGPGVPRAVRCR